MVIVVPDMVARTLIDLIAPTGIGLEDHEEPYLRGGSDVVIDTGHAFSDEPGVYIKGKVRG